MKNIMIKVSGPLTSCMQARAIIKGEKYSSFICGVDVYIDRHMLVATGPKTWGYNLKDLADNMLRYATESNYDLKNTKLEAIEFCDDSLNVHDDRKKTQKMIKELKPHLQWILDGVDVIDDVATKVETYYDGVMFILNWVDSFPDLKYKNTPCNSRFINKYATISDINLKDVSLLGYASGNLGDWVAHIKGSNWICIHKSGRCVRINTTKL